MAVWYRYPDFEPMIGEVVQTGVLIKNEVGYECSTPWVRRYLAGGVWSVVAYKNHVLAQGVEPSNLKEPSAYSPACWRRIP
ncbi:hypothetical protein ACXWOQ_09610, partial [Streptococcus pyogenes]